MPSYTLQCLHKIWPSRLRPPQRDAKLAGRASAGRPLVGGVSVGDVEYGRTVSSMTLCWTPRGEQQRPYSPAFRPYAALCAAPQWEMSSSSHTRGTENAVLVDTIGTFNTTEEF